MPVATAKLSDGICKYLPFVWIAFVEIMRLLVVSVCIN